MVFDLRGCAMEFRACCFGLICGVGAMVFAARVAAQPNGSERNPGGRRVAGEKSVGGGGSEQGAAAVADVQSGPINARQVDAAAFSPTQEELYLVAVADRLLSQIPKLSESPATAPEVRHFVGRCQQFRDYSRKRGYDAALAARFDELPGVLAQMAKEHSTRSMAVNEATARMREAVRQRREQKERNQLGIISGLGLFVLGSLPTYTNVHDSITGATLTVETGTLSPEVSDYGLSTFLSGLTAEMSGQSQLEASRSVTDEALRRLLESSLNRDAAMLAERRGEIEKMYAARMQGEKPPRLPLPEEKAGRPVSKEGGGADDGLKKVVDAPGPAVSLRDVLTKRQTKTPPVNPNVEARRRDTLSRKHLEEILAAQESRAAVLRRHLGKHEPFSAAAVVSLKGMIQTPGDKRIEQWFQDGERIAKMAGYLPAGEAFDGERAEMLGIASDLILRSAQLEVGPRSWRDLASEKAAAALPIIEAALRFDPADAAGIIREQKALACCLSGRIATGYAVAASLRPVRGESQRFRFLMARAAYLSGRFDEAISDVAFGIEQLGATDISPMRNCPDLPRESPRFRELTMLQVEGVCRSGLSGGTVAVVNRSKFPLTNVRVQLSHPTRAGRKTTEAYVPRLPPGEECEVEYDPNFIRDVSAGAKKNPDLGSIVVSSTQGRGTATVK